MKIFIVLCQDRHTDTTATPFFDLERAIACARQHAEETARYHHNEVEEEDIDGLLYYARYSCEGDCIWITEHDIDDDGIDLPWPSL